MKTTNAALIKELEVYVTNHREGAKKLASMPPAALAKHPAPGAWSALECIEHLNRYGRFYLPEILKRLNEQRTASPQSVFRSSWLGNYFAESVKLKAKLNTMKTFANMNPAGSPVSPEAIEEFIAQQDALLKLLKRSLTADMVKTRTSISISKLIRLRLGDTLRVVIYHNDRHMAQAFR
ncbi:MAG: DinB family protein, partial [Flavobacteriales bacterium]